MLRLALVNDGTRTVGSALLRADKSGAWRVEEVATGVYEFAEYQRAIALAKHSIAQDHLESRIIRTPGWSVVIVRSSKRTAAVFCNVLPGGWIRNPDAKSVEPPTQTVLEPSEALDWVRRLRSGTTSPN